MAGRTHDISEPASVEEREKTLTLRKAQNDRMIREIMGQPAGRNFFWDLLAECHLLGTIGPSDANVANYFNAERNIGLRIWSMLETAAPESTLKMLIEKGQATNA